MEPILDYSPINKIEVDWHKSKAGYLFDFNSLYWKLDGSFTLDLKRLNQNITGSTKLGFKKTICRYAEEQSAYTVLSVLAQFNNYFKYTNESTINIKGLTKYRTMLDTEFEHKLGTLRVFLLDWYNWDFDGVTQDSIKYLKELKLKGFTKGKAVKRACPYSGPLTHNELSSVISWASDAYQNQILSLKEFAYLIAIILTGRRSIQIRTLRGIDLLVTTDNNSTNYILNCPRSKQKKANFREHFNSLSINEDLYLLLKEQWNTSIRKIEQQLKSKLIISLKKQIPIFLEDGKIQQINTIDNLKEFLFNTPDFLHMTFQSAMRLMKNISHKNKARSERTGEYINLTSRRFRYTKGTNLSRKGIRGVALASALDHSDTQHIGVYTENTEETAKQIDAIMAPILAPLAQAFSGQLISSERDAVRANDPHSRIKNGKSNNIGNCGSYSFCVSGYRMCYTCASFQPWFEANHQEVLDEILHERLEQENSRISPNVIQATDRLVLAVQQIILMCQKEKLSREICDE